MKNYGCLIFSLSRLPDDVPGFHWTDATLTATLWWRSLWRWWGPDMILTARTLLARRL